ncbi:helix-turn-helix domain-containing protein [Paenibacillus oryzisoli]|uniref:helix-turn-helix domain-containing protein n=1 Tax=Paenibacillus oryzisoli TaxID=1850517 RepID=UPI003D2944FE
MQAKSLNTDVAWSAYEMLVDDYYNIKQSAPSTTMEFIALANRAVELECRQAEQDKELELNMTRVKILTEDKLPDILTPQQVADYTGISRQRVYDLCQYGELKSFTIGASRKIKKSEMMEWLDRLSGE